MTTLRRLLPLVAIAIAHGTLGGQVVRGTVVMPDSAPAAGAIVVVADERGAMVGRALTNGVGQFSLKLPAAGHYSLKLLRIGYRPTIGPTVSVASDATETLRIVLSGQV